MNSKTEPIPALPTLLTEQQVAALLAITPRHMRTLRARKLIPYVKLGGCVRFHPSAIEPAINALTVKARGAS